ncbi:hypothetical protein [Cupriavidus pauculus]|uniref:hypothetical protein n=1 Tax=Cupriavidus pauculus TaxID=82633 RepID=UPI000AFCFC00|nr:hypothetical protein [Cupriavidus pauculus]
MAQSNSIVSAMDRLALSVEATHSLAQIISTVSATHLTYVDEIACVFGYIANHLREDYRALDEAHSEKVSAPVLEAANG